MPHRARCRNRDAGGVRRVSMCAWGVLFLTLMEIKGGCKRVMNCLRKSHGVTTGIFGSANLWVLVIRFPTRPIRSGLSQIK